MKNKRSLLRSIAYILLVSVLVVAEPVYTQAATSSELQKEKDELEKKKKQAEEEKKKEQASLDAANKKAEGIADELDEVGEELEEVDQSLVETMASIAMINEEIAATEKEIEITTAEYEDAKAVELEQYESMKKRIRYMYEKGDYTYMQLLIESKSFSDMMNKAEYIEKLYDYDRKLLLEYEEAKNYTLSIKEQLEDEKDELDTTLHQLNEEQEYLDKLLAEKKEEYANYESLLKKAEDEAKVFKARVNNQNNAIKNLEKQSANKQKEIDAAKKAEEEEARRAAEEAARAAQGNSSGSTSGGYTSSGSSTQSPSGSNKTYNSASSYSSGTVGERMVQYALQFVGNPYVYGGTSLTTGADCSGFIWRIYKDFGYSIPRAGTSMRNIGREVSYEEAQPGDIICYPGHVALYMGNGRIVHASTARTGIKTGVATYKSYITIRRVL